MVWVENQAKALTKQFKPLQ